MNRSKNWLLYDGECPLCRSYVSYLRLKDISPDFALRDARAEPDLVSHLFAKGMDVDEGFVLMWNGRLHHGADAIQMLSILASGNAALSALNRAVFRSPRISALIYPVLKAGRSTLLKLLGRKKLREDLELGSPKTGEVESDIG